MNSKDLPIEFKRRILERYGRKVWSSYCQRIANFLLGNNLSPDNADIIVSGSYEFEYQMKDVPIAFLGSKGKHAWKKYIFIVKSKPKWYSRGQMRAEVVEEMIKQKIKEEGVPKGKQQWELESVYKEQILSDPTLKKEVSKRVRAKLQTLKKGGTSTC